MDNLGSYFGIFITVLAAALFIAAAWVATDIAASGALAITAVVVLIAGCIIVIIIDVTWNTPTRR